MMSIVDVAKQIDSGEIAPLYIFFGEERLLIDETVGLLREKIVQDQNVDFNFETFDLNEQPVQLAIEAAETYPFIGDKRLVVAHGASFLSSVKEKDKVEHDLEALEAYVQNPAPYSVLVMTVFHPKLDERKKIVRHLKNKAVVAEACPLKPKELIPWLMERAKGRKVVLAEDAAALLHQFVGGELRTLDNELAKMASFVGQGGTITSDVVQKLAAETAAQNVFQLINEVAEQNISKALHALDHLLERNEEPVKIVFLLARQFRLMYEAKCLIKKGCSERELGRLMGVHPYVAKLALQQGKPFRLEELALLLDKLADLDYEMKTGQVDKQLALQLFILQSINNKGVPVS